MATSSSVVDVTSFTTDAKFRAWTLAVSTAIQACGLTKTSDTGQIDHATVSRPTAANTKAGYEIYRFNDSLQATKPIFIRIDYGSAGQASGQNPSTWLTVGTATDGAGNISGVGMAVTQGYSGTSATTNAAMMVGAAYSATVGACTIISGIASSTGFHPGVWVVARTCDSSTGAPDGNGVYVMTSSGSAAASNNHKGATFSPALSYASRPIGAGVPYVSASVSSGGNVQLYKNYAVLGVLFPTMGTVSFFNTDIITSTVFTATPFGSTARSYLALTTLLGFNSSQDTAIAGAIFWE